MDSLNIEKQYKNEPNFEMLTLSYLHSITKMAIPMLP